MATQVFLEILSAANDNETVYVTIETFIALFIYVYIDQPNEIELNFVKSIDKINDQCNAIQVDTSKLKCKYLTNSEFEKNIAGLCHLPVLVTSTDIIIAGLCGVCRGIVKQQQSQANLDLLGFKGACLLAPSETSTWTRFCEIDFINCTKIILNSAVTSNETFTCPSELGQFECHMGQPIRMHNIYKRAREIANEKFESEQKLQQNMELCSLGDTPENVATTVQKEKVPRLNKSRKSKNQKNQIYITSSTPVSELNLEHTFVEGQEITLADLILYACVNIISQRIQITYKNLPLTTKWINSVQSTNPGTIIVCKSLLRIDQDHLKVDCFIEIPNKFSLYKSESKRYKPRNRVFTRQSDIQELLGKISDLDVTIKSDAFTNNAIASDETPLDWASVPLEAMPEGGQLPVERLDRKKHQLQSLAREVINMARCGDRIIDFCSGAGHLGIILAYKLPQCTIVLLENKEESLMRAKLRVDLLKLKNVLFVQSNLDYFCGSFEIGTSLHACGVATDIVLSHCLAQKANFVCCPCCYGGIHQMHHINYPRSEFFGSHGITNQDYMHIAHCADQAHDIDKGPCNIEKSRQGQYCMDIVDTDRKLKAEECGYRVKLTRLIPENCTPKNRLLVGFLINSI